MKYDGYMFAPVSRKRSQHDNLALACEDDWKVLQLHVNIAILQSQLAEPLYARLTRTG